MESSKDEYLPREIKLLVIHCSATRCNVSFPVERLRECHLQRGFRDIGYHFISPRTGFFIIVVPSPKSVPMCVDLTGIVSGFVMKAGWMKMADRRIRELRHNALLARSVDDSQASVSGGANPWTLSAKCYDPQGMSLLRSEKGIFRIIKKLREMAKVLPPVVFC